MDPNSQASMQPKVPAPAECVFQLEKGAEKRKGVTNFRQLKAVGINKTVLK